MNKEDKVPYFGMWSDLRKNFLLEERPEDFDELDKENMLLEYFEAYEDKYRDKFNEMVESQMEREGVDEELKIKNPFEWIGRVNNIRSQIREILTEEICQ